MNIVKKFMVVLLSAILFLGAAVTPVSAQESEDRGQTPILPDPVNEPVTDETPVEVIKEEEIPEEELIPEELEPEEAVTETEEEPLQALNVIPDKSELMTGELTEMTESIPEPLAEPAAEEEPPVLREAPEISAPKASKDLTDNGDGTYTLSLSVTGEAASGSTDTVHKANVVIVLDRSNSMDSATTYTYNATTYNENYAYYRSTWSDSPSSNRRVYYVANGYSGAGWYDNKYGTGTRHVAQNGVVYVSRLTGSQMAINVLSKELLAKNTEYDDLIEVQVISFASVRGSTTGSAYGHGSNNGSAESPWVKGTSNSSLMTYVNSNTTYGGTNWQAALEYAKDELDKKKAADEAAADSEPESYYAIFVTDGEPTFYGHGTQWAQNDNGYRGDGSNYDATAQSRANTAAKALVDAGYNFYSIFAFGSSNTQKNYLRRTTVYAYDGTDTASTKYDNQYFFDAENITSLMSAFQHMIDTITNNVAFGEVSFTDGMSTDVTASTLVAGEATGFRYNVTGAVGDLYTVTAEGDEIKFNVGGTEYTSTTDPAVTKKTAEDGREYYSVTVNETEYKMALANLDKDGKITWDLGAIGTLLDGYTYTVSFIVWPEQLAYDYVAGLNNGLPGYVWDTNASTYEDLTSTEGYAKGGVEEYPSIVRYENGVFAVLTNTEQSITYSVVTTSIDEEGNVHTEYGEPQTMELETADPMGLVGSTIDLAKHWLVSLDPSELEAWAAENSLTLTIYNDGKEYTSVEFPSDSMSETTDENGNVEWLDSIGIAPGIMLSEEKAIASNIEIDRYDSVELDGTTYYILCPGHEYTIEETDGSDLHFEFTTQVYHPMLVDGTLMNVSFDGGKAEITDAELTELAAENSLKGGLNIFKEVYLADMETKAENVDAEFAFTVKLTDKDGKPVYTTADQFDDTGKPISGSIGYRVFDGSGTALEGEAGRGPIPESGEITLKMPADGSIRIVNMPAGTKYVITEVQSDAYKHFATKLEEIENWDSERILLDEKKVSGDAVELTDHTISGEIVANKAAVATFSNWASDFYVYHSADNEVEKISFSDSRVKATYENNQYVFTFDIVNEVKAESSKHDYLYGGYYSNYAGKSAGYDSTKVTAWSNNRYKDADGKPYNYANVNTVKWNYKEAYDVSGFRMNPEPGMTYYLKEVPTGYLQPYTQYTYYKVGLRLANLYEITAIDDLCYEGLGFMIVSDEKDAEGIYRTLRIKAMHSSSSTQLTPAKTFKAQGVQYGYLGYVDISKLVIGKGAASITQFWDTKDGVRVSGIKQRKLNNGTMITTFKKTDTDYDNKPIDLNPPAEGGE